MVAIDDAAAMSSNSLATLFAFAFVFVFFLFSAVVDRAASPPSTPIGAVLSLLRPATFLNATAAAAEGVVFVASAVDVVERLLRIFGVVDFFVSTTIGVATFLRFLSRKYALSLVIKICKAISALFPGVNSVYVEIVA